MTTNERQGSSQVSAGTSDTELVRKLFVVTRRLTDPKRAQKLEEATGVKFTVPTLRRWKGELLRAGEVRPLSDPFRTALEEFLLLSATDQDRAAALRVIASVRQRLDELEATLAGKSTDDEDDSFEYADADEVR